LIKHTHTQYVKCKYIKSTLKHTLEIEIAIYCVGQLTYRTLFPWGEGIMDVSPTGRNEYVCVLVAL